MDSILRYREIIRATSRIECKKCGGVCGVEYFNDHLIECEKQLVPVNVITIPTDQSHENPMNSNNSIFLQDNDSIFELAPGMSGRCEKMPLQAICMNQEIIDIRPKKSKANDRYDGKVTDFLINSFEHLNKPIAQKIYKRSELENEDNMGKNESIKVPELGGKEGSVLLPKITLRSLPHFTDALEFR